MLAWLTPIINTHVRSAADDVTHAGVFSPGARDDAQIFRGRLLQWLVECQDPGVEEALRRLAADPRMLGSRDWLLSLADERRGEDASRGWSVDQAVSWGRGFIRVPESAPDLFRLVVERLEDIRLEIERGDFSFRGLFCLGDVTEEHLQKWLAHELQTTSRGHFTVTREEEVDRKKRPDVRVHSEKIPGPVSIEVKVADNWTLDDLVVGLERQLAGQYLRAAGSEYGVYLLANVKSARQWKSGIEFLSFEEVVARLGEVADGVVRREPGIRGLQVFPVHFAV